MYFTMNRFRVVAGQEDAFEAMWLNRDSHLKAVDGFVSFHLLRGALDGDVRLYVSHSAWRDEAAFLGWTRSDAFRAAHKGAKASDGLYDGPPVLETFETVQSM
jgi:heme-degrading monooxygenase HmoA